MLVVQFSEFRNFGKLPRSSDKITVNISEVSAERKLVFISHRWLRPWTTQEACEGQGHEWAGMPHPDDAAGSKHRLICAGIEKLAAEKVWDVDQIFLWLDFCGVEQDDPRLLLAGVASLLGYISVCDVVLIPCLEVPEPGERTVDQIRGDYGKRAWTRLESMSFYTVSCELHVCLPLFTRLRVF
jgi:hypothetical protein